MKRFIKYIPLFIALLWVGNLPLEAQKVVKHPFIRDLKIDKQGKEVLLQIEFNFSPIDLKKNQRISITPVLAKGDDFSSFTTLELMGRKANLYQRRNSNSDEVTQIVTKRTPRYPLISYAEVIPYEPWMDNVQLLLIEDLCGCNKEFLMDETVLIDAIPLAPQPLPPFSPTLVFIEPKVEAIKSREEKGTAFLDFQIGKTAILPQFRNNQSELNKIRQTLRSIQEEEANTIKYISIHGFASPDGSYGNNARLAEGRANALRNYIVSAYAVPAKYLQVASTPEDWVGLRTAVENSNLADQWDILQIIDGTLSPDAKEARIRANHPQSYHYLKNEIYPTLRRSEYTIAFDVRTFTLEESREVFQKNPKLLSQEELYRLALTYERGSEEYCSLFKTAAILFPNDGIAHLNAANAAILEGNLRDAEVHLEKALPSPERTHTQGILLLLQGETEGGKRLLRQAEAEGLKEATINLREFELRENELE